MALTEDTKARVERLIEADPTLSAADIGRAVQVSRERVRQILGELGYRLEWRKNDSAKPV